MLDPSAQISLPSKLSDVCTVETSSLVQVISVFFALFILFLVAEGCLVILVIP